MGQPAITGSGVFTPPEVITNEELVAAFNAYAERFNARHAADIAAGRVEAKAPSSPEFIVGRVGDRAAPCHGKDGHPRSGGDVSAPAGARQ